MEDKLSEQDGDTWMLRCDPARFELSLQMIPHTEDTIAKQKYNLQRNDATKSCLSNIDGFITEILELITEYANEVCVGPICELCV